MSSMYVNNAPKKSTLKSKKRNNSTKRRASSNQLYSLEQEDDNLENLPINHPEWKNISQLYLRGNKLKILYAYTLPPQLSILDVRDNGLETIIGEFPKTLKRLKLDRNNLKYLPNIPSSVNYTIKHNPIIEKTVNDILNSELSITEKKIFWLSLNTNRKLFTKDEQPYVRFFSKEDFEIITNTMYLILNVDDVCRDSIGTDYIDKILMLNNPQNILIEIEDRRIVAFSVFNIKEGHIDIDILCSSEKNKGGGTRILNYIKEYFSRHRSLEKILLDSLAASRAYYQKMGFDNSKIHTIRHLRPMEFTRA